MRQGEREHLVCSNAVSHLTALISILLCKLISFFSVVLMMDDGVCIPVIICATSCIALCVVSIVCSCSYNCFAHFLRLCYSYFYLSMHHKIFINLLHVYLEHKARWGNVFCQRGAHFELVMCLAV